MIAENVELLSGFEEFYSQFPQPVVVDIGGDEHHARTFWKAAYAGTLICVNPIYEVVSEYVEDNVLYVPGGYEGVQLPRAIADEVQLNFVVMFVASLSLPPIDVVTTSIATARSFAKPGVYLEVMDRFCTLEAVARDLQKKRFRPELRQLDPEKKSGDRRLCYERSSHAPMYASIGIGLLKISL